MYKKQSIGKFGEDISCKYLKKNGYNVIERNFNCIQGEIDIIAFDIIKKEIVFIEVKTRTNFNYGFPSDSVNKNKMSHMKRSIEYYVYKRKLENFYMRIDVIEVILNKGKYKLNHLKDVF